MYKLEQPIRIASTDNDINLIVIPKKNLRFEANKNVTDMFIYLSKQGKFDDDVLKEYLRENDIINVNDYFNIYSDLKAMGVIVEVWKKTAIVK